MPLPRSDVLAAAVLVIAAAGCREPESARFSCACVTLTDTDEELTQPELVCAETAARAAGVARGCAARGAPAPVAACTCAPAAGGPCRTGECLSPPR